ncbi:MAG: hypothetical protein JSU61_08690 [Fidelibacterota bacterium]|nr:MAG: hypothetical protein JSU61_08690 [Candidatus Neomarinimicrobiota bacterium]
MDYRGHRISRRARHGTVALVLLIATFGCSSEKDAGGIIFPRAFSIAIDDMGWNEGSNLSAEGGPYRAGVRRDMDVRDYRPIVEVGREVGVRFQGLFLLAEMDRENVVATVPTATPAGAGFDNSANMDASQIETMNYVQDHAAYLEFGLHGVGHEHWENGQPTRAEWYDMENDRPWPEEDSRAHMELFKAVMAQYGWTTENGQSFPESFVPCAYAYYWNPEGSYSTGKLMRDYGVKYANTDFNSIMESNPPLEFGGGFDHGLLVVNRYQYGNNWYELAAVPSEPIETFETDIIESHWPNWLASDDFLQPALNQRWIDFFRAVQAERDRYLAKNTEQFSSQWLYFRYTTVEEARPGEVAIDNTAMPDEAYQEDFLGNLVLAVVLGEGEHVSEALLDGESVAAYLEEAGFGYIYLPPLEQRRYDFTYAVGDETMPAYVNHTGTYNIYTFRTNDEETVIDLKMYGTQELAVKVSAQPRAVRSSNPHLKVLDSTYDDQSGMYSLTLSGRDMQGERGTVTLTY